MSAAKRPRRFYLLKVFAADESQEPLEAAFWRAKQVAIPGTELPVDFPARAALIDALYATLEDIDGADVDELRKRARLQTGTAEAVIAAATAALS